MPHRLWWNGTWDDYSTDDVAPPNLLSPASGAGIGNSQDQGDFGQGIGLSPIPGTPVYFAQGGASPITTSAATASSVLVANGGMTFDLQFDSASMANTAAAAAFRAGVEQAASMLSAVITDKITVNIAITYSGTGGGAAAGPSGYYESYSTIASDLISHASPGDTIFNSLPTGPSIQGQSSIAVWDAELKVWGLLGAKDLTTADGSAFFATDISSNALVGVALHELTHALGRVPFGPAPDIFDLFRFTAADTRLFSGSIPAPAAYFSIDGGITKLANYGRTSDPSDFLNSGVQGATDPFNEYYIPGSTFQNLTMVDLLQLDALGFHLSFDTTAPVFVNDNPLTVAVAATATITSGFLAVNDPDNTHAQLTYTVTTAPSHGTLLKNTLATSSFTQADIDNNLITYQENGSIALSDVFFFTVKDVAGNPANGFFQIQIPAPSDTTAPVFVNDNPLTVAVGATATITSGFLAVSDPDNTSTQLMYTVTTAPTHGALLKSGSATSLFTQADIDNGLITYQENGSVASSDVFFFTVADPAGNPANGFFQIQIPAPTGQTFTGTPANDTFTGTAGDDTMRGLGGNDTMNGNDGNDTMNGGTGNDTYNGGNGDDIFQITGTEAQTDIFNGGAGTDTMQVLGTSAVTLAGFNAFADSIEVWQGNGAGVNGTTAADTFDFSGLTAVSGLGIGSIKGSSGNDIIKGSNFGDTLLGGAGNDTITGGSGNDNITGGAGKDALTGGAGADKFIYTLISDSTVSATGQDTILDFQVGVDHIDLSLIDANTSISGNQAFLFAGQSAAVVAHSVSWFESGGNTIVQADVNGDTTADMQIVLQGINLNLHAADFVL